ncbi:MAG: Ricin-type beta-trefoil lectin domain-like, partial [Bryobacterales bacterium]|nr:Ricin-type beta-trefoil lectin domain-like [Bryobacterales bacterium]
VVSKTSGKVLDVLGRPGAVEDGVPVQQWARWTGSNELWQLRPAMSSNGKSFR